MNQLDDISEYYEALREGGPGAVIEVTQRLMKEIQARKAVVRTKFEYREIENSIPLTTHTLDNLGEDGWEMCGYAVWDKKYSYCFKREKYR